MTTSRITKLLLQSMCLSDPVNHDHRQRQSRSSVSIQFSQYGISSLDSEPTQWRAATSKGFDTFYCFLIGRVAQGEQEWYPKKP